MNENKLSKCFVIMPFSVRDYDLLNERSGFNMKIISSILILIILSTLLVLSIGCTKSNDEINEDNNKNADQLEELAQDLIDKLINEKYEEVYELFDDTMKGAMSKQNLKETWEDVLNLLGKCKNKLNTKRVQDGVYTAIFVTCEFENKNMAVRFVFDKESKIAGFFLEEPPETIQNELLERNELIVEEEVFVGQGEYKLSGTLTLPANIEQKVPAVVLVHGSGPNDRDETLYSNKPFKDIAYGLAAKGIAVLRYDKRTKVFGSNIPEGKSMNIQYEVIDDVLDAVELIKERKEIDGDRIYILGHSLGAVLIPLIGKQADDAAGYIMMAGAVTPIYELMLKQYEYIFSLDDNISESEQKTLNAVREQVEYINNTDLNKEPLKIILNAPAEYWQDFKGYNPASEAAELCKPILILQGGRDYQVTVEEYELFKKALKGNDNVEFILYDNLNHLFMEGNKEGKSTPDEYKIEQHIPEQVINDIIQWINK